MENEKRLLSIVTSEAGDHVTLHVDRNGLAILLKELEYIKEKLDENDCPHAHLFSKEWGGWELSLANMIDSEETGESVHHLKIYGWNDEWAEKHGFNRN